MFFLRYYIFTICNAIALLSTFTLVDALEDQTLDLKIGFDLTQQENGAPSLRLREFDGSKEYKPRAYDHLDSAGRADSLSNSDEPSVTRDKPDNSGKEVGRDAGNSEEGDDYDDDENNRIRSTKGLSPGEYEPEENPNIHESYRGHSASDSEGKQKRRRRDVVKYKEIKPRDYLLLVLQKDIEEKSSQTSKLKKRIGRSRHHSKQVRSARKQGVTWV